MPSIFNLPNQDYKPEENERVDGADDPIQSATINLPVNIRGKPEPQGKQSHREYHYTHKNTNKSGATKTPMTVIVSKPASRGKCGGADRRRFQSFSKHLPICMNRPARNLVGLPFRCPLS
jgi:hypothetical protein